ncbi:MAG TPA: class I SAM-dependent methyltransferase [Candidatus Competibacteraceae bacterium]|nr:class I SAM-dependent methyltransferase [Candidatus Competibacteraceae bacterium]
MKFSTQLSGLIFNLLRKKPVLRSAEAEDQSYANKIKREIDSYKHVVNVANLPDIHGYWAHNYVLPLLEQFGFRNEEEFYQNYIIKVCRSSESKINRIIALGSGNCELEVSLARKLLDAKITNFVFECTDLNPFMLERGKALAQSKGVSEHLLFTEVDINKWTPNVEYNIVIANHSLHHFVELENIFGSIRRCLSPSGYFLTHDMIGRNGHMRWPEALDVVNKLWKELPEKYKYNHLQRRLELEYDNFDCSVDGFEGIRAQDILPLLIKNFHFELFVPFGNVIDIFVDRCFGHNFDVSNEWDRNFIDRVQHLDQASIESGELKPTHMYAALTTVLPKEQHFHKHLTPEFCVRIAN